tara:strand:- start:330 stop:890 length:561 start_codon:yes stop_codon:yes gene_type:complete
MFIQTEATPNPETLKFLPGLQVLPRGTANFPSVEEAAISPLALRLFEIDGVSEVFLGGDFISVSKDRGEWPHLKPMILGAIMEHFTAGLPVIDDGGQAAEGEDGPVFDEADKAIVEQISELIETRVRPVVAQDGGDITFHGFKTGIVYLHMRGACAGCPSSTMTLKNGIERMLQHYVPEVVEVQQI